MTAAVVLGLAENVQVAAIGATATVLVALCAVVPSLLNRSATKDVKEAVGQPNGQGNVIQMLEQLLAGQTGQDARIAKLEGHHMDHAMRLANVEGRVHTLTHVSKETPQ